MKSSKKKEGETSSEVKKNPFVRAGKWLLRHKKLVCLLLVVVIVAGVGLSMYQKKQEMENRMASVTTVETTSIMRQTLMDSISLSGTVASADSRNVSTSVEKAEVTKVYVEVGDIVQAGQVICEFDSADIEDSLTDAQNNKILSDYKSDKEYAKVVETYEDAVAKEEDVYEAYSAAQANAKAVWQAAQESESKAQSAYDKAVAAEAEKKAAYQSAAGSEITEKAYQDAVAGKADLDAKLAAGSGSTEDTSGEDTSSDGTGESTDGSQGTAAEGSQGLTETEQALYNDYENTISAYQNYQSLKAAYEEAVKATASAKTALEKAQASESNAASSYEKIVEERSAAEENAENSLESAAENLESANMERKYATDESEERIEEYQQQLEDCYLTAPMDGMIISLSVSEGDIYTGGTIFVIADYQNFIVNASVDEYDISSLKKGMEAAVKIEAVSDEELPATLTYVSPTPGETTGFGSSGSSSYKIEISLSDPNEDLRIGMSAQASVVLQASEDVLTVPSDCIQTNPQGESVIYVDENGERKEVAVTVGMEGDYYVEISGDGLEEGMKVYLATPMITDNMLQRTDEEGSVMFNIGGGMGGGMPGGDMPSGGGGDRSGGGMPSGGGPSGGGAPGGF